VTGRPGSAWAYNDVRVNLLCLALQRRRALGWRAVDVGGRPGPARPGLYLRRGRWRDEQVVSARWIDQSWSPCEVKPDYGYLWWLNDLRAVLPGAPATGRCARGNGGRHLLWVDPARDLVVASHWGEDPGRLIADVSAASVSRCTR
jgi:CubicO group peptidase (beta-lactamase class C family)